VYERGLELGADPPATIERTIGRNHWRPEWRDGIYGFHHYHSTAHEVLGIARGRARVVLGGPGGEKLALFAGDVVVLPAGTGHKLVDSSGDFLVVGGYPNGQEWDLIRADDAVPTAEAEERIARVALPECDPLFGPAGPLMTLWGIAARA
jgi:uncharacterized protein YjlB